MSYMVTPHLTSGNSSLAAPPVWNTAKIQEVINQKKKKKGFEQLNCKVQSLWLLFLREFLRGNSELFIFRCDSKSLVFGFQTKCRGRKYFKYAHLWWWWCDSQQLQAGRRQMISWRYWTQKESFGILIVVANLSAHCVFSATLMCQEKVVRLPWWHSG